MRNFSNKVVASLFLLGIAGCCAVNIAPSDWTVISIIYPAGLVISIVGLFLWIISIWKLVKTRKVSFSLKSFKEIKRRRR